MSKEKKDIKKEDTIDRENKYVDIPDEVCSPEFPEGCQPVEGVDGEK